MPRSIRTLAFLVLVTSRGALAQSPIAGTWRTEFNVGIRVINGVESSEGKRQARITFQMKGDSVLGTWQNVDTVGAAMGDPRPLRGIVTDSGVRIQTIVPTEMVMRTQDGEQRLQANLFYVVSVRGDSLVGTEQWIALDHSDRGPMRPFTAVRAR